MTLWDDGDDVDGGPVNQQQAVQPSND
jgi:hypothetical protein